MRFVFLLCGLFGAAIGAVPAELEVALKNFRGDPPNGWSYTQTTEAEGQSSVERYDAAKPLFVRWSLLARDGRAPTPEELREYSEARSLRSRAGSAPKITEQFDLDTLQTVDASGERMRFRCRLRRGETRDSTAPHLLATIVLHQPTRTIESIELANTEPFSPTIGVKITEMRTLMVYSLPDENTPSLPQRVTTRVRGTAFWFKSLDADMSVSFSDYARVTKP